VSETTRIDDDGGRGDRDAWLMLRVRGGDPDAFAELVERNRDRVFGLVFRYLRDATEAEDLAQEVFLRVFRAREGYTPEAKFTTWLFRIATNQSLNALRDRAVRRRVRRLEATDEDAASPIDQVPDPDPETAEERLAKAELASEVRAAVDALPESQRTAVLLNKYEGLSYEEIARTMELSVPAVKSLLTRARNGVKERLSPFLQREGIRP